MDHASCPSELERPHNQYTHQFNGWMSVFGIDTIIYILVHYLMNYELLAKVSYTFDYLIF